MRRGGVSTLCVCVCRGTGVQLPGPTGGCWFHRALGMMVKGRMGLLASSSRAVMKHSVAAAVLP